MPFIMWVSTINKEDVAKLNGTQIFVAHFNSLQFLCWTINIMNLKYFQSQILGTCPLKTQHLVLQKMYSVTVSYTLLAVCKCVCIYCNLHWRRASCMQFLYCLQYASAICSLRNPSYTGWSREVNRSPCWLVSSTIALLI